MKTTWFAPLTMLAVLAASVSCGGSSTPIPYLTDQHYEVLSSCKTDFNDETGKCLALDAESGSVVSCQRVEDSCREHFYIVKRRGKPYFVHVNVRYPCYADWVQQAYNDPDSPYYQDPLYNVVALRLANNVTDDIVHLIEVNFSQDLQEPSTCYYRLEAGILKLPAGEYGLKVWGPQRDLILETVFDN